MAPLSITVEQMFVFMYFLHVAHLCAMHHRHGDCLALYQHADQDPVLVIDKHCVLVILV